MTNKSYHLKCYQFRIYKSIAAKVISAHVIQSSHFIGENKALSDDENCSDLHIQEAAGIRVESLYHHCSPLSLSGLHSCAQEMIWQGKGMA